MKHVVPDIRQRYGDGVLHALGQSDVDLDLIQSLEALCI